MSRLVELPIDCEAVLASVKSPECGAIVLFLGTTRQFTDGRETVQLVYEAYTEMALREMCNLEREACEKFEIAKCCIEHRIGCVPVGEVSVAVAIASPHRKAAFAAGDWVMDQLKIRLPIWKKEYDTDGSSKWVTNTITHVSSPQ